MKAWCESSQTKPPSLNSRKFEIVIPERQGKNTKRKEENSPKDLIDEEKIGKRIKDKRVKSVQRTE